LGIPAEEDGGGSLERQLQFGVVAKVEE